MDKQKIQARPFTVNRINTIIDDDYNELCSGLEDAKPNEDEVSRMESIYQVVFKDVLCRIAKQYIITNAIKHEASDEDLREFDTVVSDGMKLWHEISEQTGINLVFKCLSDADMVLIKQIITGIYEEEARKFFGTEAREYISANKASQEDIMDVMQREYESKIEELIKALVSTIRDMCNISNESLSGKRYTAMEALNNIDNEPSEEYIRAQARSVYIKVIENEEEKRKTWEREYSSKVSKFLSCEDDTITEQGVSMSGQEYARERMASLLLLERTRRRDWKKNALSKLDNGLDCGIPEGVTNEFRVKIQSM